MNTLHKSQTYQGPICKFRCGQCKISFLDHKPIFKCPACGSIDNAMQQNEYTAVKKTEKKMQEIHNDKLRQFD